MKYKHAFSLRLPDLDYRLIGNQAQYSRKKNNKKALECEGGFYTNFKSPSLFYFTTFQYITFIQEIKDSALEELKLHISLSFILLGTSVKGILAIIQFQGQGMFQCQERRALNLGEKGAGPECSVAGLCLYLSPASHRGPVPLKGGHFSFSTRQP